MILMISKYVVFCTVVERGSFTAAAAALNYSQSAVSQAVKALEQELGATLISRETHRLTLTRDGEGYLPYIQEIAAAEARLGRKRTELLQLENSEIRLGTFTSVSRTYLPQRIKAFTAQYPGVRFVMRQSEYDEIAQWLYDGQIDLGFTNPDAVLPPGHRLLYEDRMVAVLPKEHPLANAPEISLRDLAAEPFLMLDEGGFSTVLRAFQAERLTPDVRFRVYDDYTILAMVQQGLGNSILYERVAVGFEHQVAVVPLQNAPRRPVALTWKNWDTLTYAARNFARFLLSEQDGAGGAGGQRLSGDSVAANGEMC